MPTMGSYETVQQYNILLKSHALYNAIHNHKEVEIHGLISKNILPSMYGKGMNKKYRGFFNESSLSTDVEIDFDDIVKRKETPSVEVQCSQNVYKVDSYDYNKGEIEMEEKIDESLDKILGTPRAGYISYADTEVILKWAEDSQQLHSGYSKTRGRCPVPKSYRDNNGNTVLLEAKVHIEQSRTIIDLGDFAKNINRDVEPIGRYLLRILKATGAFLQNDMLMIMGVYDKSRIQGLLNRLIELYVTCRRCKKFFNTSVSVVAKMHRLQCHNCEDYRYLGRILYAPLNTTSRHRRK
ncbi:hypothetical protein PAEPH01_0014 [Pancytospora epiphaga]|nr:hypothetical protein PAEPH01_0014 [Pancytospora epiphaga]